MSPSDELLTFDQVHREMKEGFRYTSDLDLHGLFEFWVDPTREDNFDPKFWRGDCEDFAIGVMSTCIARGVDKRSFILHAVAANGGDVEDHAVIECQGWISDCNRRAVYPRETERWVNFIKHRRVGDKQWYETKSDD